MKIVNHVIETNDYQKFKKLIGNRIVNELHIKRLKQSFQKKYLQSPIIVNENFEIIDGQHRFEAAVQLNLPVNYIMVDGYGLSEVQTLNTNAKNWRKIDYLSAYVDLGRSEYVKFQEFMEEFPELGLSSCEVILTNSLGGGHKNKSSKEFISKTNVRGCYAVRYFQEGDLVIPNYEKSIENANKILMIKPFYEGFNRTSFVRAMIGVFKIEEYSHDVFLKRLKSNPMALVHCNNVTQYKELIEKIYNFRSRGGKTNLRF